MNKNFSYSFIRASNFLAKSLKVMTNILMEVHASQFTGMLARSDVACGLCGNENLASFHSSERVQY